VEALLASSDSFDLIGLVAGQPEKKLERKPRISENVSPSSNALRVPRQLHQHGTVPSKTLRESALYFPARSVASTDRLSLKEISPFTTSCTRRESSKWSAAAS